MRITPLAADGLGARSMATLVETPDVTIRLDPSVRLAPSRYDLPPHPTEEERQKALWRRSATPRRRPTSSPYREGGRPVRSEPRRTVRRA